MRPGIEFPPLLLLQAAWLLTPGLLAGLELHRRGVINRYFVVPVAAVISAVFGYAAFWLYFANRGIGDVFSYLTLAISAAAGVVIVLSRPYRGLLRTMDVAVPLALLFLVTLFYSSISLGCSISANVQSPNDLCHQSGLSGDDILPLIFANAIHHGDPRALVWTWQLSARPPLQAGYVLMQTPVTQRPGWQNTSYLAVSILLQVFWLPALWAIGRSLRLTARRLAIVTTLFVFSGFFVFNSVFTWPKLLAAGLGLTAFGLFFFEKASGWTWALGGVAAAAALLAHTGVVFAFFPMAVALLLRRYRRHWRLFAIAGLVAVVLFVPWQLYQKLYDPPGDGLLKLHIGGGLASAQDRRTLAQLVYDNYTEPPASTIAKNKLDNVTTLIAIPHAQRGMVDSNITSVLRDQEIRYTVFALGLFHLGWLALLLRSTRRRLAEFVDLARLKLMLILAGFATLIWVLIEYGPPQAITVIFANSYATVMLMFAALGVAMTALPRRVLWPVLAVQVGYATVIWVIAVWWNHIRHPSYIGLSALAFAAVLALLGAVYRWSPSEPAADVGVDPPATREVSPAL